MEAHRPQFPIGIFKKPEIITKSDKDKAIEVLANFPKQIATLTATLDNATLDKPYREGSWSIRQLIHHVSDSHTHAYNRLRWTLSENTPTIKAYDQDAYAKAKDYRLAPISWSIDHLRVIHQKLVYIFQNLTETEWKRSFIHPETNAEIDLEELVLTYAWHSAHHYAHIENALA